MSRSLYIFIDESGTPHQGDYYTVAACWCISNRNTTDAVLSPTKNRIALLVEQSFTDSPVSELKAADYPPGLIDQLVPNVESTIYEDKTLKKNNLPWSPRQPIQYTIHNINPNIGNEILENSFGSRTRGPETLKTMILVSVLNPLFYSEQIDRERFESVRIVLDADVWESARRQVKRGIRLQDGLAEMTEMTTQDSKSTPGIQIADLAAYAWARNLRKGDCRVAKDAVSRLLVS